MLRAKYKPGKPLVLSLNRGRPKELKNNRAELVATIREYAALPPHVPVKIKDRGGLLFPGDVVECICGTKVLIKTINYSF